MNKYLFFIVISIFLTCCDMDSENTLNIIGTKWNRIDYEFGVDKTIIFENNNLAYMMDKVIRDEPIEWMGEHYNKGSIIYTYYTYTYNENNWIGKIEAIEEYMLDADFYILGNGNSMLIKNEAVEYIFIKM